MRVIFLTETFKFKAPHGDFRCVEVWKEVWEKFGSLNKL